VSISIRTIATFAVAIFLGVVAVMLTRGYVGSVAQKGAATALAGSVPVVVAAQPLDRGVVLQPHAQAGQPAEAAP
jgi:pilus assembly protein CpaB